MWNHSLVIPCMLVMATLLFYYASKRRLSLRLNRTFLELLALQTLVPFFDYLSTIADESYQTVDVSMLYALNTAYFVCFMLRAYWFFRVALDVMHAGTQFSLARRWLLAMPCVACSLVSMSSFLTGAFFSIGPNGYQSGPAYGLLYGCFALYLALALVLMAWRKDLLRPNERLGILAYSLVLAIGLAVRYLLPRVLVMDTFCTVAILIIYLSFLNPDLYLSDNGLTFNMRGLRHMLKESSPRGGYGVLALALHNYSQERGMMGSNSMGHVIAAICGWLLSAIPGATLFYLRDGRFMLVDSADANWKEIQGLIRARFEEPWDVDGLELRFRLGFAFTTMVPMHDSSDGVINSLLLALDNMRDPYGATDPSEAQDLHQIDRQLVVMRSLEHALEHDGVEVFLQPLFDTQTQRVVAAEALARIRDEHGEVIPPGEFIPLAEKGGLMDRLGTQVFEKACSFVRDHDMVALGLRWINVNLSPQQCLRQDLARNLSHVLERYGVRPDQIHLEITEQSMVDYALLKRQMLSLSDDGFPLVLDDYGTGYSNLMRVRNYPFVNVKLDMALVWDYFDTRDDLLPMVVQTFSHLGMSITAEGIETEEMAEALSGIGCEYLQGYLYSRPLPADEFVQVLAHDPGCG